MPEGRQKRHHDETTNQDHTKPKLNIKANNEDRAMRKRRRGERVIHHGHIKEIFINYATNM